MLKIYAAVAEIFCAHEQLNYQAMNIMQSLGFNGLKRKHRCAVKHILEGKICLANRLFDNYRIVLKYEPKPFAYAPKSLKEHLAAWDAKLATDLAALGKLNKKHFDEVGVTNSIIESAMCAMAKCYEKTGRWYKRLDEAKWNSEAMHLLDDHIHKKYKAIEGD